MIDNPLDRMDRRAVSIAITHALTFGITAVLVSALLFSAGQFLGTQERNVADNQLSDVGSEVVSHINSFDRLNETGTGVEASIEPDYPDRVVGHTYTIRIVEDEDDVFDGVDVILQVDSRIFDRPLLYPLQTDTPVDIGASMTGNDAVICLQDGLISLGSGCT